MPSDWDPAKQPIYVYEKGRVPWFGLFVIGSGVLLCCALLVLVIISS